MKDWQDDQVMDVSVCWVAFATEIRFLELAKLKQSLSKPQLSFLPPDEVTFFRTIKEDSLTDITENCLFAKCIKYRDLLWIHEDSKKLWKTIEIKCNCKCITEESKNLEVRSCPLNETLVIEQRIELHGGVEYWFKNFETVLNQMQS